MVLEAGDQRRWQRDIRSPKGGLAYICRTRVFADCQFTVGARIFKGHRLILAARSPLFAKMLMKDGSAKLLMMTNIDITDMSEDAFEMMLNYIYTDSIGQLDSQELVLEVYQAAMKYGQEGLKEACEQRIKDWDITCDHVISVLQMSDVQFVRDRCWDFLSKNARTVLKSDGILPASSDTLALIFERGYFNGISSLDLLTNVVRWAEKQYSKQTDYKRVREHLMYPSGVTSTALISWIGFEKLTPTELGQVISNYPKLLTDEEVRIFFQYSFSPEDKKPDLPNW